MGRLLGRQSMNFLYRLLARFKPAPRCQCEFPRFYYRGDGKLYCHVCELRL